MARLTPKQLDDQLKKQQQIYGDGDDQLGGSATDPAADDDTEDALEDIIGNEPNEPDEETPFSFADEVDKDEAARRSKPSPGEEKEEEEEKEEI